MRLVKANHVFHFNPVFSREENLEEKFEEFSFIVHSMGQFYKNYKIIILNTIIKVPAPDVHVFLNLSLGTPNFRFI